MDRADAQWADSSSTTPSRRLNHGGTAPRTVIQRGDLGLSQARQRVSEERERRFVEPLEIVDAEQEPPFLSEALERTQERERDEPVVVRTGDLCDSERRLERPLLLRRQTGEHVIGNSADQVRETRERIGPSPPPSDGTTTANSRRPSRHPLRRARPQSSRFRPRPRLPPVRAGARHRRAERGALLAAPRVLPRFECLLPRTSPGRLYARFASLRIVADPNASGRWGSRSSRQRTLAGGDDGRRQPEPWRSAWAELEREAMCRCRRSSPSQP